MDVPTPIFTENTLEDLGDRERRQMNLNIFLFYISLWILNLQYSLPVAKHLAEIKRKRVNINKKIVILGKMRRKMVEW